MIELTQGAYLWGLVALGAPIIAHWMNRQRGVRVVLPTVRFVMQAVTTQGRRRRMARQGLLILRLALVGAIVLVFARPVWTGTRAGAGLKRGQGADVVYVIDASASMQRSAGIGGASVFEEALGQASASLESLDGSLDRAGVIVADRRPEALWPEMTSNLEALAIELKQIKATREYGDLSDAVSAAIALLDRDGIGGGRERFVHVFTDGQKSSAVNLANLSPAHDPAPPVVVHTIRAQGAASNWAVVDVTIGNEPVIAGMPFAITAQVQSFSDRAIDTVATLTLGRAGGDERAGQDTALTSKQPVHMEAGGTVSVRFAVPGLIEAGAHVARVGIEGGDGFGLDDERSAAFVVRDRVRLGLLSDRDVNDRFFAPYFVLRAMMPDEGLPFEVRSIADRAEELNGLDVVVCCDVVHLPSSFVEALGTWLKDGHGVIWVADSLESVDSLGLLVGEESGVHVESVGHDAGIDARVVEVSGEDHAFAQLSEISPGLWRPIETKLHAHVRIDDRRGAILRTESGEALLCASGVGSGRLVVFAGSMDPDVTALARQDVFVVLWHEMVMTALLNGDADGSRAVTYGETVLFEVPDALLPAAWRVERARGERVVRYEGVTTITCQATEGVNNVRLVDGSTGQALRAVSVQLDRRESDPADLGDEALKSLAALGSKGARAGVEMGGESAGARLRPGRTELWPFLMVLAVLLAAGELAMMWFGSSRVGVEGGRS